MYIYLYIPYVQENVTAYFTGTGNQRRLLELAKVPEESLFAKIKKIN